MYCWNSTVKFDVEGKISQIMGTYRACTALVALDGSYKLFYYSKVYYGSQVSDLCPLGYLFLTAPLEVEE